MLISPSNGNHEHIHLLNHGVTNEKNGWWMFQDQTLDIMTYDHKSLENNFQLLGAQDRNLLRSAYRSIVPAARIERRQIYSCFFLAYRFSFVFFHDGSVCFSAHGLKTPDPCRSYRRLPS
jgi:hypothetical protein